MLQKSRKRENSGVELALTRTHLVIRIPVESQLIPLAMALGSGSNEVPYLPPQTKKVFEFLRKGLTNKEIANQMGLSVRTVKFHMTEIFKRVGATCRMDVLKRFGYSN
jgi:DNA-binding NarL/FixJ family response regulator